MTSEVKQLNLNESEQDKVNEVRKLIGPLSGNLDLYCSDSCIVRYLRARNWNVNKATKMLRSSLNWRLDYKPEEICWDDVSSEAETGKIYRANYKDKSGRSVLVIRPRCENSKSVKGQIKHFVYCMEHAILNLSPDQEQMVWLIDFHGFSLSNISIKVTRETAHVLQEHYPERLGVAVLYDAPKIFEPFWMVAKPFLEAKTANKVKFVYSGDENTKRIMDELFDTDQLEAAFGGKDKFDFDTSKYAERMREEDEKMASFWKIKNSSSAPELNQMAASLSEPLCSGSDPRPSDKKEDVSSSTPIILEELSVSNGSS